MREIDCDAVELEVMKIIVHDVTERLKTHIVNLANGEPSMFLNCLVNLVGHCLLNTAQEGHEGEVFDDYIEGLSRWKQHAFNQRGIFNVSLQ